MISSITYLTNYNMVWLKIFPKRSTLQSISIQRNPFAALRRKIQTWIICIGKKRTTLQASAWTMFKRKRCRMGPRLKAYDTQYLIHATHWRMEWFLLKRSHLARCPKHVWKIFCLTSVFSGTATTWMFGLGRIIVDILPTWLHSSNFKEFPIILFLEKLT